jgi:uncharacterized protein YlxW (UPF0749 family)
MAAWFIPALKAVLPHVGMIISAAAPAFTKKRLEEATNQTLLLQQQIGELQAAATQNAAYIKELAAQLQDTVAALEQAAALAEARLRRVYLMCIAAVALSLASVVFVVVFVR